MTRKNILSRGDLTNQLSRRRFFGGAVAAFLGLSGASGLTSARTLGSSVSATNVSLTNTWKTVSFDDRRSNPVVFALPPSYNGTNPASTRLRNVGDARFDCRIEEWEYLDEWHRTERAGCLAVDSRTTRFGDAQVEAGRVRTNHHWARIDFGQSFSTPPVVLTQSQTTNGPQAVVTRNRDRSTDGVSVRLQEEEALGAHMFEQIGYLAIEPGSGTVDGTAYEAGLAPGVDDGWTTIRFDGTYQNPVFLADLQTTNGGNTATLRYRNLTERSVEVFVEEEQSDDAEQHHIPEDVGYVVFDGGSTSGTGSGGTSDTSADSTDQTGGIDRVIGYYTSWSRYDDYMPTDVPLSKLTHLNFAFLDVTSEGTVTYIDESGDKQNLEAFKRLKQQHPDTRMMLSVGGWSNSKHFSDAALTADRRARFASTAIDLLRQYDFDGIDIDWEYPTGGGMSGNTVRDADPHNFTLLLQELRRQLDEAGKADGRTYELSIAAPADPSQVDGLEVDAISQAVDFVNVMSYDYVGTWSGQTSFNSPLFSSDGPSVATAMAHWASAGMPTEKLNLGLAFYGRGFASVPDNNDGLFQSFSGSANLSSGDTGYTTIRKLIDSDDSYRTHWSDEAKVPWAYSAADSVFITYDNPRSIGAKTDFAIENSYGGVMFWECAGDRNGALLDAINERR